jgi:hypothetical protein
MITLERMFCERCIQGIYYNQPGNYDTQPRTFEQQGLLPSNHFTTPTHGSQLQGEQYQQPWGGNNNADGFPRAQDVSSFASPSQNPPVSHRRHYQTHSEEFVHNPPTVGSNAPSRTHPRDIASASANTSAGTQNPAAIGSGNPNAVAMQPVFPTAPLGGSTIPRPMGTNTAASRRLKSTPQASTSTKPPSKRKAVCNHCSYRQIKVCCLFCRSITLIVTFCFSALRYLQILFCARPADVKGSHPVASGLSTL